jgi:hypothetical protein
MEEAALSLVLCRCVEALEAGDGLEEVLQQYPALSGELRPLLVIAWRLYDTRDEAYAPPFPDASLRRRFRVAGVM